MGHRARCGGTSAARTGRTHSLKLYQSGHCSSLRDLLRGIETIVLEAAYRNVAVTDILALTGLMPTAHGTGCLSPQVSAPSPRNTPGQRP